MSSSEQGLSEIPIESSGASRSPPWSLFVGGDTIIQDEAVDQPFRGTIKKRMRTADLTVVNLEGPVESSGTPLKKSGAIKESIGRTPSILADAGVDAVTLANNHAMDHGATGLVETIESCGEAGIQITGAGTDATAALEPATTIIGDGDTSVALVSLCEREFGVAGPEQPGTAWIGHPDALDHIETAATESDVVIVFAHGGIEYVPFPPPVRRRQLRQLVHAGADAVIGHHPHVAQGWEVVDGAPICYSLGNFLFEQPRRPSTHQGFGVELRFGGSVLTGIDLVPVEISDGGVQELTDEDRRRSFLEYVDRLSRLTRTDLDPHWQEVADRIFIQRYGNWLRESGGGDPIKGALNPGAHLRKGGLWDPDRRESELLTLLNLVRNESHRSVIETALELRTGVTVDRRTPETRETVKELLNRTEDRRVFDPPSKSRLRLEALLSRLGRGTGFF